MHTIKVDGTDYIPLAIALNGINQTPVEDVVPRKEVNDLEYKLIGVMHSVDKWLEGDELNQDEVNRAATMREKTLNIVEELQKKLNDYKKFVGEIRVTSENHAVIIDTEHTEYIDKRVAECLKYLAVKQAKQEVAKQMSVEIEHEIAEALKSNYKALSEFEQSDELYYRVKGKIDALRGIQDFVVELEKKYIGETNVSNTNK